MKNLEPNNHRISNSLFESIQNVMSGKKEQVAEEENAGVAVDKAHFCATHVEHALLGQGVCISEQHAEPDENGNIEWYSVQFPSGIQRVNTSNLKITEGKSHTHGKKMAEESEEIEEAKKGDGNLANNYPPYDKVTRGDVIAGRLGKDQMGGKKKVSEVADPDNILPKASPAPVSKSTEDKEKKGAMSKAVSAHNTGKGGMDAARASKPTNVGEARSTGTVFDKPKDNPLTKDIKSPFTKKTVSTGTIYSRKPEKDTGASGTGKKIKTESITQTVINYNDFVLEITDNPTYGDYLKALQGMVESRDETIQSEVVALATEAYNEKIDSIIVEAKARITFEPRMQQLRESGVKVLDENYSVEDDEAYVEYTVEKDGKAIQYVHVGTVQKV